MKKSNQLYLISINILALCLAVFIAARYLNVKRIIQLQKDENTYLRTAMNYLNYSSGERRTQPAYKYINPVCRDDYIGISSPFGIRNNPLRKNMGGEEIRQHNGIDLTGTWHGRVVAVAPGKVIEKWYVPDGKKRTGHPVFGGYIRILHEDGFVSGYGHLSSIYVHEGEYVNTGQVIGRIGSTGKSTGDHLHFSLQDAAGNYLQPLRYISVDIREGK